MWERGLVTLCDVLESGSIFLIPGDGVMIFFFAEAKSKRLMGTGAYAPESMVILRIGECRVAGDCVKETLFFGELFEMLTN